VEIVWGRTYRIVARFPWGARVAFECDRVRRDPEGTIRWTGAGEIGLEPCLDGVLRETETWVLGWCGGTCDVTVVIAEGPDAPEP
jgi:hypothetical protein